MTGDWWVMEKAEATRLQSWYPGGKHYISPAPHPGRHSEVEETGLLLFWEKGHPVESSLQFKRRDAALFSEHQTEITMLSYVQMAFFQCAPKQLTHLVVQTCCPRKH